MLKGGILERQWGFGVLARQPFDIDSLLPLRRTFRDLLRISLDPSDEEHCGIRLGWLQESPEVDRVT